MKKLFVILSVIALASCGGSETKETVVDSVVVDSVAVDSVAVDTKVDTAVSVGGGVQNGTEVK